MKNYTIIYRIYKGIKQNGVSYFKLIAINKLVTKKEILLKLLFTRKHKKQLISILKTKNFNVVIIFLPIVDWNISLFQRPQQMAIELGAIGYISFYCTPNYSDKINGFIEVQNNCYVTNRLDLLMKIDTKKVITLYSTDKKLTIDLIHKYKDKCNLILYEYIDEMHEDIGGKIPQTAKEAFHAILKNEFIMVVSTATKLYNDVNSHRNKNHILVTNGVDYKHFSQKFSYEEVPEELKPIYYQKKPIIGYFGALAKWFDLELIKKLSSIRPNYNIVLIGKVYDNDPKWYNLKQDNIYIIGPIEYKYLPQFSYWFDVCIIPFLINEITESTSPIKLFEYMAMTKPIVTTEMPECRKYKSVLIGENHEDFIVKVDLAITLINNKEYIEILTNESLENTWKHKAIQVSEMIIENLRSTDKFDTI